MSKYKRIFIVGHSGAGKEVLAQAIAKKLGWKFIDADFGLAPTVGRRLSEIIGNQGEEAFHNSLFEILSHQISQENIVVTTDDSIVCAANNRQLLSTEFTVFLKVSTAVQLDRISHNRPLLPIDDYKMFLDQLRDERDSLYEQVASYSINSDSGELEEYVRKILEVFGE